MSYLEKLATLFNGHEAHAIPHETIIGKLDEVSGKFHTSVFFELGRGYWSAEAEERLRAAMTSAHRPQNGSKSGEGNSSRVLVGKVHR